MGLVFWPYPSFPLRFPLSPLVGCPSSSLLWNCFVPVFFRLPTPNCSRCPLPFATATNNFCRCDLRTRENAVFPEGRLHAQMATHWTPSQLNLLPEENTRSLPLPRHTVHATFPRHDLHHIKNGRTSPTMARCCETWPTSPPTSLLQRSVPQTTPTAFLQLLCSRAQLSTVVPGSPVFRSTSNVRASVGHIQCAAFRG